MLPVDNMMHRLLSVFLCLTCLAARPVSADVTVPAFTPVTATVTHIQQLRQGGHVIYMRHGKTDARFPDKIPVEIDNCNSQRPLSAAGREQLDQIGLNFAELHVPVGHVISSPFCRAIESTRRVFGDTLEVDPLLRYTASMPAREKQPAVERTRYWISLPLENPADNRVVVAHGPNIAEIMDYLPGEATMVIFRPASAPPARFQYVASITPDDWPALLHALELTRNDEDHP